MKQLTNLQNAIDELIKHKQKTTLKIYIYISSFYTFTYLFYSFIGILRIYIIYLIYHKNINVLI